ncbi:arylsulfatase [Agromyces italicus]|uniref:arylsulfatase n=1 Tax=Agromyces italicus TaxID=279572 RepID=UPI00047A2AE4|nr:arylsulfatase [Agromyces italicus]
MRTLPPAESAFGGRIAETQTDARAERPSLTLPPQGAPNVVVVMLDDVGFGAPGAFGGPVPTPALDRVVADGVHYNRFHTTALCSPSRAALLTGRNHHSAHMGAISEIAYGFPGYDGIIPKSTATIAEVLRQNGFGTAMFGKAHITPMWETSPAGPFDRWPTGLGFDRFYGFLGGEASQWEPALYDQTQPVEPHLGRADYHLTEDLADQAIDWMRLQKTSAPERPFFVYFSPGATHAPHHVAPEWSDPFRGRFDAGWDALREEIFDRQRDLGLLPDGTTLTPRPEQLPAWSEYDDRYKPVASRLMEVYAGFLAHTDAQVGRLIDAIDELGEWQNTLFIYITGDNGASAEGGVHGVWSAPAFQNGSPEDPEWLLAHIDDFGTPRAENHFNAGWAWALDAPFQWTKQVASHFGGTRNGLAVSWPAGMCGGRGMRSQFHHIIDIAPTILDAAGVEAPELVGGVVQKPVEGVSMRYSFDAADAPSTRRTQYFEILGNRALYHDGWIASCFHGRVPWIRSQALPFGDGAETWELYDIANDFSQSNDLAAERPEKLRELRAIFDQEARRYGVYPLSDETTSRALPTNRPSFIEGRTRFRLYPANVRMPELASVNVKNTSFDLSAHLDVPVGGAEGVVICQGGAHAGWSLYLRDGHLVYVYNLYGRVLTEVAASLGDRDGRLTVGVGFDYDGGGLGKGGAVHLRIDGDDVAHARVEQTVPFIFSMSGETLDVGVDTGSPVGRYPHSFPFTGTIDLVEIELRGPGLPSVHAEAAADGRLRAAQRAQ